jgi:hypothetical protein
MDGTRVEEAGFRVYAEWNLGENKGLLSKVGISKYGRRERFSSSKEIPPARTFADLSRLIHSCSEDATAELVSVPGLTVDKDRMDALQNELADLAIQRRGIEGEIKKWNEAMTKGTAEADNLKQQLVGARHHFPMFQAAELIVPAAILDRTRSRRS